MADAVALDPIAFWKTRSFWLAVFGIACQVATRLGYDLGDAGALSDTALDVVSLVTLALAYRERANPRRRVALKG